MNPFIEWEGFWRDFHSTLISTVRELLLGSLPLEYDARIEEDTLIIDPNSGEQWHRYPDVAVTRRKNDAWSSSASPAVAVLEPSSEAEPVPVRADHETHRWIEVFDQRDGSLVTSIEIMSPTNKLGKGRDEFRFKRMEIFDTGANLVDIDLLLGGLRLPFRNPLPPGEFFGFVSRQSKAPLVQVYAMPIVDQIRPLPIPLRPPDADVVLDLHAAYDLAFTRGGYPRRLKYAEIPSDMNAAVADFARTKSAVN